MGHFPRSAASVYVRARLDVRSVVREVKGHDGSLWPQSRDEAAYRRLVRLARGPPGFVGRRLLARRRRARVLDLGGGLSGREAIGGQDRDEHAPPDGDEAADVSASWPAASPSDGSAG